MEDDGTSQGTVLVKDINENSSQPSNRPQMITYTLQQMVKWKRTWKTDGSKEALYQSSSEDYRFTGH